MGAVEHGAPDGDGAVDLLAEAVGEGLRRAAWLLQPGKTNLTIDEVQGTYSETCNMYRDFTTTYSDVPLRNNVILKLDAGFKVYDTY